MKRLLILMIAGLFLFGLVTHLQRDLKTYKITKTEKIAKTSKVKKHK